MSEASAAVTPESPWLGLRPFTEEARAYFFGRDDELDDLHERVLHRPLTILFGQSGLGKTSLVRAGLVPRLRDTGFLPVVVRVGWTAADPAPEAQVLTELRAQLKGATQASWSALADFPADVSLWRLLHDAAYGFLPDPSAHVTPRLAFLFDQFEEIFTIGQRLRERADAWRDMLAALVENRPPAALRAQLKAAPSLLDRLDLRAAPAKVVLILRHDYLYGLERWRLTMPSLLDNRFELKHLNGRQALQAVLYPGQLRAGNTPIVDENTAGAIVRFVSGVPAETPLADIEIVPPFLSLVCAELNTQRLNLDAEQIIFDPFLDEPPAMRAFLEALPLNAEGQRDPVLRSAIEQALVAQGVAIGDIGQSLARLAAKGLLTVSADSLAERIHISRGLDMAGRSGPDILQTFYNTCFAGLDERVRAWLEEVFLSPEGFRQSVNDDTAAGGLTRAGLSEAAANAALDALVVRRVLTVEEHGEVRRFELTHDILAPIVRDSRDRRRAHEAEEAARLAARLAEEAAKAEAIYAQSARGLRSAPQGGIARRGSVLVGYGTSELGGKRGGLSDYFWDDLLTYIEEGTVVPIVGREAVTIETGNGRTIPLHRYLAELLAQRLGAATMVPSEDYSLNDLVYTLIERGTPQADIYSQLALCMRELPLQPPRSLLQLAEIAPFKLFVTLTFDSLLAQAVDTVRYGGVTERIAYSPATYHDLSGKLLDDSSDRSIVYQLFGRVSPVQDYVVSDEDMLEFFYALQSDSRRPGWLFDRLSDSHLLLLGCSLPDWPARFFVRMIEGRHTRRSHSRILVVDGETARDSTFQHYAEHFSPNIQMLPGTADDFLDELSQRWRARSGQSGAPAVADVSTMPEGAIYLSYAAEDESTAQYIKDVLRTVGVTVWSNNRRLADGEQGDHAIRRDIANCAYFMPLISNASQSRPQGLFRREWVWAAERALGMAVDHPFLLPVVATDTVVDRAALPTSFTLVQPFYLSANRFSPDDAERVKLFVRDDRRRRAGRE